MPNWPVFATFLALKRCVGLMRRKTGQTFKLVRATPVTRKAIGLSSTQCAAKFLDSIISGLFGCHQSWDSVLGGKWDLLPARNERDLYTLIKSLKFNENRDFLMSTIQCHLNACRGRYAVEDNYREVFRHNMFVFMTVFL